MSCPFLFLIIYPLSSSFSSASHTSPYLTHRLTSLIALPHSSPHLTPRLISPTLRMQLLTFSLTSYPPSIHQFLYPPIATITPSGWSYHCCCIIQQSPLTHNFSNAISPKLLITFVLISSRWSDPSVCCTQNVLKYDEYPCCGCLFSWTWRRLSNVHFVCVWIRVRYSTQHRAFGETVATDCYFVITTLLMI